MPTGKKKSSATGDLSLSEKILVRKSLYRDFPPVGNCFLSFRFDVPFFGYGDLNNYICDIQRINPQKKGFFSHKKSHKYQKDVSKMESWFSVSIGHMKRCIKKCNLNFQLVFFR